MDREAYEACLRAVRCVARSARLCAVTDIVSAQYKASVESSGRMIDRAQSYYERARLGHAPTERNVRLLGTAVAEARRIVTALTSARELDSEDLEQMANKVDRCIARAGGLGPAPEPETL